MTLDRPIEPTAPAAAPPEAKERTLLRHLLWIAHAHANADLTNEERMTLREAAEFIEARTKRRQFCDDECVTHCPLECGIEAARRRREKESLMGGIL